MNEGICGIHSWTPYLSSYNCFLFLRKKCKYVYIRGTKSQPMDGFLVHNMKEIIIKWTVLPRVPLHTITKNCHNRGSSSYLHLFTYNEVYERDCSICQGISLLPPAYKTLSNLFLSTLTQMCRRNWFKLSV